MSTSNRPHKKLRVWQMAMELTTRIYEVTTAFPRQEEFGLSSQLRRAAVSVPSNIAEGLSRGSPKEKVHFLYTSQGSLSELDTQVELARQVGFLEEEQEIELLNKIQDVQMLLSGLIRSLRQKAG